MPVSSPKALATSDRVWSAILVSDPGALRLRSACRTTLAVTLSALCLGGLVYWHELPLLGAANGILYVMMAAAFPREALARERLLTMAAMAVSAGLATVAAALLEASAYLGEALFLGILFWAVAFQSRGPRAMWTGFVAVVSSYLALFLRAQPADIGWSLAAMPIAFAILVLVCFVIVPERPLAAVRRILRTVERQGAEILLAVETLARERGDDARLHMRSLFTALNETILTAEDQLAALEPKSAAAVSIDLMRIELALVNVSAAIVARKGVDPREQARLRLAIRRLSSGRMTALRRRNQPETPFLSAIVELDHAVAGLRQHAQAAIDGAAPAPAKPAGPASLAWRPAIRATAAAFLSMVGGQLVSPDRWFWAVLTAYLVFLGARSRGDTVQKGLQRVWGTLAGLVAGVLASVALSGHLYLEIAALVVCLFCMTYVFAISQVLAIFSVTVMLGLVYSLIGMAAPTILLLRLEETAIGAAAGILVGLYLLPRRTRDHVAETGRSLLTALAAAVRLSADRLAGDGAAAPVAQMRQADRILRDLRLALRPLRARRTLVWWARRPAELPAILACMFWVRVLATSSETMVRDGDSEVLSARMRDLADRLEEMGRAGPSIASPAPQHRAIEIGTAHLGQSSTPLLETTLANLDGIVDLMRIRFGAEGWNALVARRPL